MTISRRHAQTDHHPEYDDRTPAKMGSQPLRSELTERFSTALGLRPITELLPTRLLCFWQFEDHTASKPRIS
jgi:hypothetical protein